MILENMVNNSDVVERKGITSYSPCKMKWVLIFATLPVAGVSLHDVINKEIFQTYPKLDRPFRLMFACEMELSAF